MTGVYFLYKKDEVVYVGQSVDIERRITEHPDKKFDSFKYIECNVDELDSLEERCIKEIKPKYNKAYLVKTNRLFNDFTTFSIRLLPEDIQRVRTYFERRGLKLTQGIRMIIKEYMEREGI